ncbi:MAG: hypothetical protein QQW96_05395 [Tychonema bourrellyi B0820]|nr:hypothetical protein [Tychonema bourrellyi]MDQ2097066.1 hypothetical protein [Tychonema bourrellyi B0820]
MSSSLEDSPLQVGIGGTIGVIEFPAVDALELERMRAGWFR